MRLLLRLLIGIPLALIGAAVVAAIVAVATIDPNDYRGRIADGLRNAIKQPVALRGPLRWTIGLTPTLSIEDVVVGDPGADTAAGSLQIGKLEVAIEVLPFLTDRIVRISSLTLDDVTAVVDLANLGGSAARATEPIAGAPPPAAPPQPEAVPPASPAQLPDIVAISVSNVSITVRDRPRDRAWQLVVARASLTRRVPVVELDVEGRMNDTPFTAQGTAGVLATLGSGTWPVDVTIRAGELGQVRIAGSVVDAFGAARPDLALTFEGPELQRVAALAGIAVPAFGAFRGEIKVAVDQAGAPTVPAINLAFGRPELLRVAVEGSVADPQAQRGIDLRVTAEGREIGALSGIALPGQTVPAIPAVGPFQVRAHVTDGPALDELRVQIGSDDGIRLVAAGSFRDPLARRGIALDVELRAPDVQALARLANVDVALRGGVVFQARLSDPAPNRFRFENLRATLGPNDAAGEVTMTLGGARPVLAGALTANRVDLASLGVGPRRGAAGAGDGRVFGGNPLPFEALGLADANLQLRAARLDGFIFGLRNVAATVTLRDGELAVRPWSAELAGGQASGELTAASRGALDLRASLRGFNAGALLREAQLSDRLDGGRGELTLELRGTGRSLRAIMATANGSHTLIVRGGTVDNRFFEIIGADLVRWLGQMVRGAERPTLTCAISRFDIRDGLATARVLMFDTSQITAAGEGTINLATEALALRVQPRPRDASLLSLAVPLDIAGTLSRPTFSPNTLGAIGRTGAGVVLGPISTVLSIARIGQGRDDPCATATALAQGQAPPRDTPSPAPSPSQNPLEAIGDGIGRGIRGIFGR